MEEEGKKETKKINIEGLKKELEEYQRQKEEYLAGWQRARADFLNYKKEEMERIEGLMKYANEGLIIKILPILDSFELAEKNLKENMANNEYVKGLLRIKVQLLDFLKCQGVEEIKSLGDKFDPNLHEAVEGFPADLSTVASAEAEALAKEGVENRNEEPGVIIEEVQKGYLLNGKVIRPAKVKVTK